MYREIYHKVIMSTITARFLFFTNNQEDLAWRNLLSCSGWGAIIYGLQNLEKYSVD